MTFFQNERSCGSDSHISASDLDQIRQWNRNIPESTSRCLHDLVIEQAKSQPDKIAVDAWDGSFTYGELDHLSFHLSLLLVDKNIVPGSIVTLCLEKSKWTTIAMLGVLRAGGAFALIDSGIPLQRATTMTKLLHSSVLLTSPDVKLKLDNLFPSVLHVNSDLFTSTLSSQHSFSLSASTPYDPAIVLFTSGSTGAPKAILQDHICASTTATGLGTSWNIGLKSRILQFAAYAFDMSVIDTFMALVNGACLCVPTQDEFAVNPMAVVERMQVNFSAVTASVASTYPVGIEKTLRTMVLGGEKVPKALIELWADKLDVYNGYGPAEGSVCSFTRADASRSTSIGTPLNTLAWVVDAADFNKLVSIGDVGELLIEGPMLAKGYLKDPDKTKVSFIQNPGFLQLVFGAGADSSRRFYKTGDLVRQYSDGTMDYCGRKDLQTKIRGQRVELSEVEYHVQKALPTGWVAVADVIEIDSGSSIVAFLRSDERVHEKTSNEASVQLLAEKFTTLEESLRKSLTLTLPPYMVPSILYLIREIPMSLSGKTDRAALKRMGVDAHHLRVRQYTSDAPESQVPKSDTLEWLQEQWARVLRLESRDINSKADFFALGGNSLLAMLLVAKLNTKYPSAQISVRDIFSNQTLHLQSLLLELRFKNEDTHDLTEMSHSTPSIQKVGDVCEETGFLEDEIEEVLEATDSQTNMLWAELTNDACEVHHCVFNFEPAVDTSCLKAAIKSLMRAHSIMRTCFVVLKGRVFQCVLKDVPPSSIQTQDAVFHCTEDGTLASYEVGPRRKALHLVRFNIECSTGKTKQVVLRISHCMFDGGYDGGFMHRILLELSALFQDRSIPKSPPFSARCMARLSHLAAGIEYWKLALQDATPSRIVAKSGPQDANLLHDEVVRTVDIPCMPAGVTTATLLKAAWALVLSEILQTNDVVFANITSGRALPIEDAYLILGPCISTIPIRVRIQPGTTVSRFLTDVQNQYLDAMPYETVGLQTVAQECTNWPRWEDLSSVVNDLSEENFIDQLGETVEFGNGHICNAKVSQKPGKWVDIAVQTKKNGNTVHARLQFTSEVVAREVVEELDDMLVANIKMLCSSGEKILKPAPCGPLSSATTFPIAPLRSLNSSRETRPNSGVYPEAEDVVRQAWQTVFDVQSHDLGEMPYFNKWPIACAYGLQKVFAERNYIVTVDDLIHNPKMKDQILLLARNKRPEN